MGSPNLIEAAQEILLPVESELDLLTGSGVLSEVDIVATVLGEEHLVADLDVHGDDLAIAGQGTGAHGDDLQRREKRRGQRASAGPVPEGAAWAGGKGGRFGAKTPPLPH